MVEKVCQGNIGLKSFEKYITDWFKDDYVVDGKTVDIFTTLLMNFDASNLETPFIVTAYMDITFSTENGDTTIRVWAVGETVRSVKQVAELALMDYKETSGGDYIVGLSDTLDFLITKRKMIAGELQQVMHRLSSLQKETDAESEQPFDTVNIIEIKNRLIEVE